MFAKHREATNCSLLRARGYDSIARRSTTLNSKCMDEYVYDSVDVCRTTCISAWFGNFVIFRASLAETAFVVLFLMRSIALLKAGLESSVIVFWKAKAKRRKQSMEAATSGMLTVSSFAKPNSSSSFRSLVWPAVA